MSYDHDGITIHHADCRDVLPTLAEVDAVVTDPPYGLGFMGKDWDHGVPGVAFWRLVLEAMKPGAHLLAFGGTRTFHRLTCAIEDAGFEIRDCLMWVYGSGFPKSLDVSKAIDKAAGAEREVVGQRPNAVPSYRNTAKGENGKTNDGRNAANWDDYRSRPSQAVTAPATAAARQWEGWGTALKPAYEPIILARKPLIGTVAENVLEHGTGGINVDGCRIGTDEDCRRNAIGGDNGLIGSSTFKIRERRAHEQPQPAGRWPANLIHDGSDEVVGLFPVTSSGALSPYTERHSRATSYAMRREKTWEGEANAGSAARFFYCAKASAQDRGVNDHPTVKPLSLMKWLVRLVTPPRGLVLDPFMGSGTTLRAAKDLNMRAIGIDTEESYCEIAIGRLAQGVLAL